MGGQHKWTVCPSSGKLFPFFYLTVLQQPWTILFWGEGENGAALPSMLFLYVIYSLCFLLILKVDCIWAREVHRLTFWLIFVKTKQMNKNHQYHNQTPKHKKQFPSRAPGPDNGCLIHSEDSEWQWVRVWWQDVPKVHRNSPPGRGNTRRTESLGRVQIGRDRL